MDRTCRFAVIALGAVTLSNVVNGARLSGQSAPAVIWNFDSLSPGQPPAGFSFGRTGGGRVGHWIVQSAPDAPSLPNVLPRSTATVPTTGSQSRPHCRRASRMAAFR